MIKITTEETARISIAIFLAGGVSGGSAGKEEIRIGRGKVKNVAVAFDLVQGGLEEDRKRDRPLIEPFAEDVDAFAANVADIIGKITPDADIFVAVKTANFDASRGRNVGNGGHLFAGELEEICQINGLILNHDFEIGDEASVDETGNTEAIILTALMPSVAFDNGVAK